ncbi:hypothetical protein I4U23_000600 [Adineta vaga]|nr:hypothetical protein I4U23_000600 [Adineta vaga]
MSHDHSNSERKSIWETKERMPTVNEIPTSAYRGSQAYPYNDYNQAMQSYRHGICGPSKKHFIGALLIATIVGLTISGIPLGVMTTLYIQEKSARNCNTASTNSNSSSGSGSSGSSVTLPSQCSTYTTRSEADRNAAYTSCSGCYCDSSLSTGWYRFTGASGTRLATSPVNTQEFLVEEEITQ